jgi:uncharacterized protein (TIGR02271 family)
MTRTIIGFFDSAREAEQAAHHLGMDVGGVRGEVYDARRTGELPALRMPGEDAAIVAEAIRRGGAILHATVPDDRYAQVVSVMERDGAYDVDERTQTWRQEGWSGGTMTGATVAEAVRAAGMTAGTTAQMSTTETGYGQGRTEATGRTENIPIVEEHINVGKRAVQGGRVRVRSYVVETPVEEQVTLREEHVSVEHRPLDRPVAPGDDAFRERVIEATETREEAVVAKEARVTEEVVVRKEAGERTETVRDTVRRTEVEVEDEAGRTGAPGRRRDRT